MNGEKGKIPDLISRFKVELQRDKKRTTILVILLIVGGIVGGRFVVSHSPPDKASAAGAGNAVENPLPDAGNQSTGLNVPSGWVGTGDNRTRQVDFASMDRTINRDLFWPNTRYFPPADRVDTPPPATQPDQAQQLAAARQREHRKRTEHIKSIRGQAKALFLTSTMLGRSPTALINGQVLRTGEMINGFCLKSITSDCCVITKEGVDVELQMRE